MSTTHSSRRCSQLLPPRPRQRLPRWHRRLFPLASAALLAGCASLPPGAGMDAVAALSQARIGAAPVLHPGDAPDTTTQARVAEVLQQPLQADDAVVLALLNNRGLQARFAAVGVANADLVRASRPANPRFSVGRLHGGGSVETDRAVVFDVQGLLTLPWTRRAAADDLAQAQLQAAAAADTVSLAAAVRNAYFQAVAAAQLVGCHTQVQEAADAASDLALRMHAAGNFSKLTQMREQVFQADARAQLARARHQALATRERLARLLGAAAISRAAAATLPEAAMQTGAATQPPPPPPNGRPFQPIVTLNGWSLPWRMVDGVKEFHLVAEPVQREIAPGMVANLWDYNSQSPGPTIEGVEGDRVRIDVTNRLPEVTMVHWHGTLLLSGMDGVAGLTQPPIPVGKTWVDEFVLQRSGTFMYHPHADEMVQMAMGMMGLFIVHPKDPRQFRADRDYGFILNAYDIEPGSATPRVNTRLDFNLWTWNSRAFPGIAPFVARTSRWWAPTVAGCPAVHAGPR